MKSVLFFIMLVCTLVLQGTYTFAKDIIVVSIPPQAYFLQKIVGNTLTVTTFLPKGADAHTFEPSMKVLRSIAKAKIFFTVGVGLEEQWKKKLQALAPSMVFIPSYVEVATPYSLQPQGAHQPQTLEYIREEDKDLVQKNKNENNKYFTEIKDGVFAPVNEHVWTSPQAMRRIVEQMLATLCEYYPQYATMYAENANKLIMKIDMIDEEIRVALQHKKHRTFISYHPSWKYFAGLYRLQELVIENRDKEPSAKAIASLIATAKTKKAALILTQPQYSQKTVKAISKDLGNLPIISLDPLQSDWFALMHTMKKVLSQYLN